VVFLEVSSLDEKMPNGGTKTHAGDGSAIAPDDKAFAQEGTKMESLDEKMP
jgi:hypothetical protein